MSRFERVVIQLLIIIANRVARSASPADRINIDHDGWPMYGDKPF